MFRIWAKLFTDNQMIRDLTVEDGSSDTRTHKVMRALEQACYEFDLDKPSGWRKIFRNSAGWPRPDSMQTTSSAPKASTIWNCR